VQSGDTAGKLAAANKPATISLDQMLVALLRSNPMPSSTATSTA
jgi:pilus assembly protein FimV